MELPKIVQCVLNTSSSQVVKDKIRALPGQTALQLLSAQKSKSTRSRKSVATFQLRKDNLLGCTVNLRDKALYSFLDQYATMVFSLSGRRGLTCPPLFAKVNTFARGKVGLPKRMWHKRLGADYNFGMDGFTFFPGLDAHFLLLSTAGGFNCTFSVSKCRFPVSKGEKPSSFHGKNRLFRFNRMVLLLTALQFPIVQGTEGHRR